MIHSKFEIYFFFDHGMIISPVYRQLVCLGKNGQEWLILSCMLFLFFFFYSQVLGKNLRKLWFSLNENREINTKICKVKLSRGHEQHFIFQ